MKAIVLAAGYATRLYPLTKDKPKPLLEVQGKPILSHIIDKIAELPDIDEVFVATNKKFFPFFEAWKEKESLPVKVKILDDGTTSNDDRLGGIGDIKFVLEKENISEEVLVVAGDNLFNFSLKKMLAEFKKKKAPFVGLFDVGWMEEAKKFGIVELDSKNKVVGFEEKPEQPNSTLAATLIYFLPAGIIDLIKEYLAEGNCPDAPGYFMKWLYRKTAVYGFVFHQKWFDIGSFESLEAAQKEFTSENREENGEKEAKDEEEEGNDFFGLRRGKNG